MKSIVVYDSYFGNTELVATTIYNVLQQSHNSKLIHISEADELDIEDYDLVVVGSPTRYYKPTKPILEFVREIKAHDIHVAFFDTRMDAERHFLLGPMEQLLGFAADSMVSLAELGQATMSIEPLGVYVKSTKGPVSKKSIKDIETWATLTVQAIPAARRKTKKQPVAAKASPQKKATAKPVANKAATKPSKKAATRNAVVKPVAKKATAQVPTKKKTATQPGTKKAVAKPVVKKSAPSAAPRATNEKPVYAVDLSTGKRIDLTTMTVAQLKQFAKDNFNKGYEDLNRVQLILLNGASAIDIKEQARQQGVKNYSKMRKSELIKILTSTPNK
jgi:flavodoxin